MLPLNEVVFACAGIALKFGLRMKSSPIESNCGAMMSNRFQSSIPRRRSHLALERSLYFRLKHFVTPESRIEAAIRLIRQELEEQLKKFESENKNARGQRLNARTRFDLEMLQEVGHCPGVENYSRPLSGKPPGATPYDPLRFLSPKIFC